MLEEQRPRRVVPRWRRSSVTARTPEARTAAPSKKPNLDGEVAGKRREFDSSKSVPVAAELMFLASEAGNSEAARTAAQVILDHAARIGSTKLVHIAKQVLEGTDTEQSSDPPREFIREARKLLSIDFRNPVLLMDVARELTAQGQDKAALRYVRTAVALAPQSRFVLRSAARYYLHTGEHEIAHDLLRASPLLRSDPWVQASEIAVATVRGRTSAFAKQAAAKLGRNSAVPAHMSELATAVATVELLSGADKSAKRLFQGALAHPNDNSLAQAEWAAPKLKLIVDDAALRTPLSWEANSHNSYRRLQLSEAIRHAKEWCVDEPFASRPYDTLCYLCSLEGRYDEAQRAAEGAMRVDSGHGLGSRLNLLFTKIQSGDIDGADDELVKLSKHSEAKRHAPHLLANAGALAYAAGEFAIGSEFYQRAIKAARERSEPYTEALARAFYARTAALAGDPKSLTIIDETAKKVERLPSPGAIHIVRSLVDAEKRQALEATIVARVAKRRWTWDVTSNTLRAIE